MKKTIIVTLLGVVLITTLSIYYTHRIERKIRSETRLYMEYLGDTVIIKSDTLVVTDFSIWDETFKLDDGTKIHKSFIMK